jgi:hypothetical protein
MRLETLTIQHPVYNVTGLHQVHHSPPTASKDVVEGPSSILASSQEGIEQGDGRAKMCMRASQPLLVGEGCLTGHGHGCPVSKAPPLACGRDILDQLLIPETSLVPAFANRGTEAQLAQSIEKFREGAHQRLKRLRVIASPHAGTVLCIGAAVPVAEGQGGQRSVQVQRSLSWRERPAPRFRRHQTEC